MTTSRILPFNDAAIEVAAELILRGECVAVPTETVYGLAADATDGAAVAGIYAAKGRPSFNPLIVHVPNCAAAERIAVFNDAARGLAARYWPGPLTMVLPLRVDSGIASLVTAGLPTVALRVPDHPAMQALLSATGKPLAAPSANKSGSISPTTAAHVHKSLGGLVPLIIDAGPTSRGLESTIVSVDDDIRLLRPGPIDLGLALQPAEHIEAPGQMTSHYAPSKPVRLNATSAEDDEVFIGFGAVAGRINLSADGDLVEAASRLFDALHQAEDAPQPRIAIAPIPHHGLGLAINDRIARASS